MRDVRMYSKLLHSKLMAEFGLDELALDPTAIATEPKVLSYLFHATAKRSV